MRTPLPYRRQCVTVDTEWAGHRLTIGVGFDAAGVAKEVFADHAKVGSDQDALIDDACVVLSIALQHGATIKDISLSLGRESTDVRAPAASVLGLVAQVAAGVRL